MHYVFLLPALVYLLIFSYIPLYGIQIAFKRFTPGLGIFGSPWVGFLHFKTFFTSYQFWTLLKNTLGLSLYMLVASTPIPVILALLLHYCVFNKFKKITQTITYAPHFISMVVLVGMILVLLSLNGPVNQFIMKLGRERIFFMGKPELFRHIYVWSGVWQRAGWSSIIFIATLTSISPELHEAAIVDGANKLQRIIHIDLPGIMPTFIVLLILNTGQVMSLGFEKAFLMQNSVNIEVSEIISTYVYKVGLGNAQFSYSTAIGIFNNVINFALLISVNRIARHISGTSLW
jgi:putative aldouronate transport system permease protein